MRAAAKFDYRRRRTARQLQRWMLAAFTSMAVRYCLAAERDEKNGFPLAAAMEWRKAAKLFGSGTPLADRCWREWERIMRLPRRLAEPIGASEAVPYGSITPEVEALPAVALVPLAAAA